MGQSILPLAPDGCFIKSVLFSSSSSSSDMSLTKSKLSTHAISFALYAYSSNKGMYPPVSNVSYCVCKYCFFVSSFKSFKNFFPISYTRLMSFPKVALFSVAATWSNSSTSSSTSNWKNPCSPSTSANLKRSSSSRSFVFNFR